MSVQHTRIELVNVYQTCNTKALKMSYLEDIVLKNAKLHFRGTFPQIGKSIFQ